MKAYRLHKWKSNGKLELMHLVALAEAGKLQLHVTKYNLSDVQTAIDKLHAGEIVGRAVVVPDGH